MGAGVAKALAERFQELGRLSITLIVDVDPEVYRLGYGDPQGLETIKRLADENFLELRQQPGVSIGLLIADNKTMIYSPTPHLIEAGSLQSEKPNAIVLESTPEAIDHACASGSSSLFSNAEIGKEVIQKEQLDQISKNLKDLPPKRFDVARIERVFNSRIQYVEFKVTKYKLSKKTAPIPHDLMGLEDDPDIQDRWRNAFRMFDGTKKISVEIPLRDESGKQLRDNQNELATTTYGEKKLEAERREIEKKYFYKVVGYGVVISRADRDDFDKHVKAFKLRIQDYQKAVKRVISASIDDTIKRLLKVLLPSVRKTLPARYRKSVCGNELSDSILVSMLEDDLRKEFGKPDEIASPDIKVQYKDISYETIHDEKFKKSLRNAGIHETVITQLFSEYDSAPEFSMNNQKTLQF